MCISRVVPHKGRRKDFAGGVGVSVSGTWLDVDVGEDTGWMIC